MKKNKKGSFYETPCIMKSLFVSKSPAPFSIQPNSNVKEAVHA